MSLNPFNKKFWSIAGYVFYSAIKNVDFGVQVRHGKRNLIGGLSERLIG